MLANWQMLSDPHLFHRGFYAPIEHPVVGVYPTATWPWRFSRSPARLTRAAPVFAQYHELLTKCLLVTSLGLFVIAMAAIAIRLLKRPTNRIR